jgi:hypothetical protein
MRRTIAFALVGGLALGACGTSTSGGTKSLRTARAARSASSAPAPPHAPFVDATTNAPGTLAHSEGARSDVHDTTCVPSGDAWTAAGRVTNPTSSTARYRIYVSFLRGDTTVGVAETASGPVRAGATTGWDTRLKVRADGLRCILRVERSSH